MSAVDLVLLYDYYGDLLTDRQKECFELRYYQDLSLGEIGEELGISRQGVHDNLSRAEALLRNMEEKTGCASRDQNCRKAAKSILDAAKLLNENKDPMVSALAQRIIASAAPATPPIMPGKNPAMYMPTDQSIIAPPGVMPPSLSAPQ